MRIIAKLLGVAIVLLILILCYIYHGGLLLYFHEAEFLAAGDGKDIVFMKNHSLPCIREMLIFDGGEYGIHFDVLDHIGFLIPSQNGLSQIINSLESRVDLVGSFRLDFTYSVLGLCLVAVLAGMFLVRKRASGISP